MAKKKDWKENLFNKTDYDWTDKQFEDWRKENRKHIKHYMNGRADHKRSVRSISDIMYAHRMDRLYEQNLNPFEQAKKSNELWREHLKRVS